MSEVTLLNILRDWLDKGKYPIVAIVGWDVSPNEERGQIWIGDYDVATIFDDKVEFTTWSKEHLLYAADPDFFTHLENNIKHLLSALKDMSDERVGGEDRSRSDNEGLSGREP